MNTDHLDAVAAIEQAGCSWPWQRPLLADELANPATVAFVAGPASNEEVICGHIFLRTAADEAEILKLTILPEMRRRGIAQELLGHGLKQARQRGAHTCFLEVRLSNCPARRLYERMGFIEVGRRPHYYLMPREDALIMRRVLDDHRF